MKIGKNTVPYSLYKCEWDSERETWLFSWGEEIPDDWVKFSITHDCPVESINEAYELDPVAFELSVRVINEILDDHCEDWGV